MDFASIVFCVTVRAWIFEKEKNESSRKCNATENEHPYFGDIQTQVVMNLASSERKRMQMNYYLLKKKKKEKKKNQ